MIWAKGGRVWVMKRLSRGIRLLLLALCSAILAACLPDVPTPAPLPPTATITNTPSPTQTIVWFPATATYTPYATQIIEPTQDFRAAFGSILFRDTFTDTQQWQTSQSAVGNIAYGNNDLTLAVAEARGTLITLRKTPSMSNNYLQIDALPSLCRGSDVYGVQVRAISAQDGYRVLVRCDGKLRVERVKHGEVVPLQDWMQSSSVMPGGMLPVRLGVLAVNQEMRIFLNDVLQCTVKDPLWNEGMVGLYARSAGDTPLTVSFSNLVVYQVRMDALPALSVTPRAGQTPTPTRARTQPAP